MGTKGTEDKGATLTFWKALRLFSTEGARGLRGVSFEAFAVLLWQCVVYINTETVLFVENSYSGSCF